LKLNAIKEFQKKLLHSHVEIIEATQSQSVPDWANSLHSLPHQMILFVAKGDGEIYFGEQIEQIEKDALFLFLPGSPVRLRVNEEKPLLLCWILFDRFVLSSKSQEKLEFHREDSFPIQGRLRMAGSNSIRIMGLLMSNGEIETGGRRNLYGQQLIFDLLHDILDDTAIQDDSESRRRLQATIGFMLRHYQENIQMSEIAEIGQFHPSYYSQIFKQTMGKTPMAFLTDLRMNRAKELLLTTQSPVSDIATSVGYNDAFYFSRRFKEKYGYSPSVFVQNREVKTISLSSPYTDQLYTLGHIPQAAQIYRTLPIETQELLLPEHGADPWNANREVFMKAKPDLILCKDNVLDKAKEHINDIAPIVSIPWASGDVYQHMKMISELVNRQQMASSWLDNYEKRAEAWRRKLKSKIGNATVAVCVCRDRELRMYGARNIGHVFYRTLNLSAPERISKLINQFPAGTGFTWSAISPDDIKDYEADFLFVAVDKERDKQKVMHWIHTNMFWASHPAVLSKRLSFIDREKWIMYSPSGLSYQLDEAGYLLMGNK
jgi:ABC-type Fe3+-hydroxamate transport system, periplasmic component